MNFRLARDQVMCLETAANLWEADDFFAFLFGFSIFELGGITKHLISGPAGNGEFCFPRLSMFPGEKPKGIKVIKAQFRRRASAAPN